MPSGPSLKKWLVPTTDLEHREAPGGVSGATTRAAHGVQHDSPSMARGEFDVKPSAFATNAKAQGRKGRREKSLDKRLNA